MTGCFKNEYVLTDFIFLNIEYFFPVSGIYRTQFTIQDLWKSKINNLLGGFFLGLFVCMAEGVRGCEIIQNNICSQIPCWIGAKRNYYRSWFADKEIIHEAGLEIFNYRNHWLVWLIEYLLFWSCCIQKSLKSTSLYYRSFYGKGGNWNSYIKLYSTAQSP